MNCQLYLIKRDGSDIRFICPIQHESCFEKNPTISDAIIKDLVHQNRMNWELYVEEGSIESIVEKWEKRGKKFKSNKHKPVIPAKTSNRTITKKISLKQSP